MNTTSSIKVVTKKLLKFQSTLKQIVYDWSANQISSLLLNKNVWNIDMNRDLVQQIVVAQQASWRLPTKKTKDRSEVSGGGKKPWRQKGTGRARHGSIRSPIWKGGGVTFGPSGNENYRKKHNRKVFRKGIKMLLADFLRNSAILIWENADLSTPKTKKAVDLLNNWHLTKTKVLFVVHNDYPHLQLSINNLVNVNYTSVQNLNPYDLLSVDKLLIESKAVPLIEQKFI